MDYGLFPIRHTCKISGDFCRVLIKPTAFCIPLFHIYILESTKQYPLGCNYLLYGFVYIYIYLKNLQGEEKLSELKQEVCTSKKPISLEIMRFPKCR